MGTVKEWGEVLVSGALWGGLMMLWQVLNRRAGRKDPAPFLNLLTWALAGLGYGLGVTFRLRAIRWPLVTIMAPTIVAMVLGSILYAKKLKKSQSDGVVKS